MRNSMALLGIALLCAMFAIQGCSDNDSVTPTNQLAPPSLPSVNTMKPNLTFFESAQVSAGSIGQPKLTEETIAAVEPTRLNFLNAAYRTLFLELVVFAALVEPVAAFEAAINSVPQLQPDSSWLWTYIFVNGPTEYSIFLSGKQMDQYVAWRMVVSSNDTILPLDHFLWFDGHVQNDQTSGYWQFYEPVPARSGALTASVAAELATPGVPCIRIDWQHDSPMAWQLALLVNKVGVPEEGSTLTFTSSPVQSSIVFYYSVNQSTGTIIWYPNGSGSIEWPDYRGGVKSCWGTRQLDAICP